MVLNILILSRQISTYIDGSDAYNWSEINSVDNANYAFFKTDGGIITDILVIIPSE